MDKPLSQSLSETNGILIRCCNSAKFLAWRSRALCDLAIRRNCGPIQFLVVVVVVAVLRHASHRLDVSTAAACTSIPALVAFREYGELVSGALMQLRKCMRAREPRSGDHGN